MRPQGYAHIIHVYDIACDHKGTPILYTYTCIIWAYPCGRTLLMIAHPSHHLSTSFNMQPFPTTIHLYITILYCRFGLFGSGLLCLGCVDLFGVEQADVDATLAEFGLG
jgi:hypothetical protein